MTAHVYVQSNKKIVWSVLGRSPITAEYTNLRAHQMPSLRQFERHKGRTIEIRFDYLFAYRQSDYINEQK